MIHAFRNVRLWENIRKNACAALPTNRWQLTHIQKYQFLLFGVKWVTIACSSQWRTQKKRVVEEVGKSVRYQAINKKKHKQSKQEATLSHTQWAGGKCGLSFRFQCVLSIKAVLLSRLRCIDSVSWNRNETPATNGRNRWTKKNVFRLKNFVVINSIEIIFRSIQFRACDFNLCV